MAQAAEVDLWFAEIDHPKKAVMKAVREVILAADDRVTETIKWKAPTFTYRGNILSFNPQAKRFVSLLFHRGAEIPGHHPALSGGGDTARYMQIDDREALERLRPELEVIIRDWCDWRDAE